MRSLFGEMPNKKSQSRMHLKRRVSPSPSWLVDSKRSLVNDVHLRAELDFGGEPFIFGRRTYASGVDIVKVKVLGQLISSSPMNTSLVLWDSVATRVLAARSMVHSCNSGTQFEQRSYFLEVLRLARHLLLPNW